MQLNELKIGTKSVVLNVKGDEAIKRRMMDMGITRGAEIAIIKYSPFKDPIEIEVRGFRIALRKENAKSIEIKEIK